MSRGIRLDDVLRVLPGGALLPANWVREQLEAEPHEAREREVLLTVGEVAARYARAESTVRGWCAARKLPGAFKLHGAEWRVPESSLVKFDENQSFGGGPALGQGRPVDIASWRREGAG